MSWTDDLRQRLAGVRDRLRHELTHHSTVLEHVGGRPFVVLPSVFNPTLYRSSAVFLEALDDSVLAPGARVLDLGCGAGVAAVTAASFGCDVTAVDINAAAVRCAEINALLNQLEDRVRARSSDLFEALEGERFDVVMFNPPYMKGQPNGAFDHAFAGGDVAERFAAGLADHLTGGGFGLVILSSLGEAQRFIDALGKAGFTLRIRWEQKIGQEMFWVYRVTADAPRSERD